MSRRLYAAVFILILTMMLMPQGISAAQGQTLTIPTWHGIEDSSGRYYTDPSTAVIVHYIWVARTAQQVEDFKTHADITVLLDGQPVFNPQAGVDVGWQEVELVAGGTVARARWAFQLAPLPEGTYTVRTLITLDAPVSDGIVAEPFAVGAVNDTTNIIVVSADPAAASAPQPIVSAAPAGELICDRAVGTFVKDAVGYWAPDATKPIEPEFIMPAGKTLWVFGMDESQRYYQVLLDIRLFWVRADTMAPTQDWVWQGTPLPNCPVQ